MNRQVAPTAQKARAFFLAALCCYLLLIALTIAWEGFLAPVSYAPPGVWLTVKSLVLLIPLFALLRGEPRAFMAAAFLLTAFFVEGIVVAWTTFGEGTGAGQTWIYALMEAILCLDFFVTASLYVRLRAASGPRIPG
jgi:uncharacterized membrane protein